MIEKLQAPSHPIIEHGKVIGYQQHGQWNIDAIARRLNEVIEAVNDLSTGPVLQRMQDNASSFGASLSVPEAEPPEQEEGGHSSNCPNWRVDLMLDVLPMGSIIQRLAVGYDVMIPSRGNFSGATLRRALVAADLDRPGAIPDGLTPVAPAAQPGKGV